jgi:hypothetical protein
MFICTARFMIWMVAVQSELINSFVMAHGIERLITPNVMTCCELKMWANNSGLIFYLSVLGHLSVGMAMLTWSGTNNILNVIKIVFYSGHQLKCTHLGRGRGLKSHCFWMFSSTYCTFPYFVTKTICDFAPKKFDYLFLCEEAKLFSKFHLKVKFVSI